VPIDDTHTLHISYQCYAAPPQVPVQEQDVVPYYEPPIQDENGKAILDYVLAQDALVWWSQGERTDRSKELLGRTDIPIVLLRKQLAREIDKVENGEDPMNVFREHPGDILFGAGQPPEGWSPLRPGEILRKAGSQAFRRKYHLGFAVDDVDRYGPITDDVAELHRRIEEWEEAQDAGETAE